MNVTFDGIEVIANGNDCNRFMLAWKFPEGNKSVEFYAIVNDKIVFSAKSPAAENITKDIGQAFDYLKKHPGAFRKEWKNIQDGSDYKSIPFETNIFTGESVRSIELEDPEEQPENTVRSDCH